MTKLVELSEVGSTNDWIAAAAGRGESDGLWVRADRQTEGRGRRGRTWVSDTGNLFASCLVRPDAGEQPVHQFSFVAALALHDALANFAARDRLRLKWPNDVLLDGVKCAGILIEGRDEVVIVGCGANLAHHPEGTERPATSLPAAGLSAPSPSDTLAALASSFDKWRQLWRARGFLALRDAWLERAAGLGEPIVARLGRKEIPGRFSGIATDGALELACPDGSVRRIHSGEVFSL
ncbi:biotin--[acetyl-CoA-carboxylase] ligase [Pacificimonas flava]|uniref:biotin--[acetyl-CoA-carboxylase] ligase n=1 Tax=Pacificimonas flava TaxID=1234595 RepID=UPI001CCE779F|nr:biotin--[acetyl-CoA-carboxylase] ligase [Pacificimonas flava]